MVDVIDNIFAGVQETVALQAGDSDTGSGGGVAAENPITNVATTPRCNYRSLKPYR